MYVDITVRSMYGLAGGVTMVVTALSITIALFVISLVYPHLWLRGEPEKDYRIAHLKALSGAFVIGYIASFLFASTWPVSVLTVMVPLTILAKPLLHKEDWLA